MGYLDIWEHSKVHRIFLDEKPAVVCLKFLPESWLQLKYCLSGVTFQPATVSDLLLCCQKHL